MNKLNTLYLSYDGLTDPLGQSQVLPYLLGLSEKGWVISVVSFEKEERFKEGEKAILEKCAQNKIEWHPLLYHKRPPVLSTLLDLHAMRRTVEKLVLEQEPGLIHCRSYLPMLVALAYQKKGIKVIFDMRGFWADERVEGKIWSLKNPLFKAIFRYFKRKEKDFIQQADAIVSLTNAALPFVKEKNPKGGIVVIPTAVDLELFDPKKINSAYTVKLKKELGLDDSFVLGYSGSLGTWYLLEEMLSFFKTLLKVKKASKFLILTQDDPQLVYSVTENLSIPKASIIIRSTQRNEMPLYLSLMDASVFFIKASFSKLASSPTKLGEFMAMGIPVICNDKVGDVKEIVEKYEAGIVLSSLTMNEFENATELIEKGAYYNTENMKKGAIEYYDLGLGVDKYDQIYKALL